MSAAAKMPARPRGYVWFRAARTGATYHVFATRNTRDIAVCGTVSESVKNAHTTDADWDWILKNRRTNLPACCPNCVELVTG